MAATTDGHGAPEPAPQPARGWARLSDAPATTRLALSVLAGVAAGIAVPWGWAWHIHVAIGWCVFCVVKVLWLVPALRTDHSGARSFATREDETERIAGAVSLAACVVSLVSVGLTLHEAHAHQGGVKVALTGLAVLTVVASWFLVHLEFMARYTREYFAGPEGGIDFPSSDGSHPKPTYIDFLYVALTLGMTFQVSDTSITTKPMRRLVIRHTLLAYLFGVVIIAVTISAVAGIVGGG